LTASQLKYGFLRSLVLGKNRKAADLILSAGCTGGTETDRNKDSGG